MQKHRHALFGGGLGAVAVKSGQHHDAVLGHAEGMFAVGLAVPARDAGKTMGDVVDFDVKRGGVDQIKPPA